MSNKQVDRIASSEQMVASVATVIDLIGDPPVAFESFAAAAAERGWVTPVRPSLFVTDLPTVNRLVVASELDGRLTSVSLRFTNTGEPRSGDIFADYADAMSERWGQPARRKRGNIPAIHLALPSVFVTLTNFEGNLMAEVLDPQIYFSRLATGSL